MLRMITFGILFTGSAILLNNNTLAGQLRKRHCPPPNCCPVACCPSPSVATVSSPVLHATNSNAVTQSSTTVPALSSVATESVAAPPVTQAAPVETPAPQPTRSLYFTYPFGVNGPERHNMWDVGPDAWIEELPDGQKERFTVLGRWTEYSSKGILARKDSTPDLFIFLPDADQPLKQLLFRMADKQDWPSLGEITEVPLTEQPKSAQP